jgi:hypothetical protein
MSIREILDLITIAAIGYLVGTLVWLLIDLRRMRK